MAFKKLGALAVDGVNLKETAAEVLDFLVGRVVLLVVSVASSTLLLATIDGSTSESACALRLGITVLSWDLFWLICVTRSTCSRGEGRLII